MSAGAPIRSFSPRLYWRLEWADFPPDWRGALALPEFTLCVAWEESQSSRPPAATTVRGVVRLQRKSRPFTLLPRDVAWTACRRSDFVEAREEAKARPGAFTWGLECEEYRMPLPSPYPWQQAVLAILRGPVDPRTIYWIWERGGNTGKTTLLKHICSCLPELRAIVVSGRPADVNYAICEHHKRLGSLPGCVLMNLPRSFDSSYLSYTALECVKDMLFFSPKYGSCMVNGEPPHVMIFANVPPDAGKLSRDRWRVREIRGLELADAAAPRHGRRAASSSDSE